MKMLAVITVLFLMFAVQSHATPVLYNLTGQKTADQTGTLYGSAVYDPVTKLLWDHSVGVIYSSLPTFVDNNMNQIGSFPIVNNATLDLFITPIAAKLMVVDIKNGKSLFYPDGDYTLADLSSPDWFNSGMAVRANGAGCQNCNGVRWYEPWEQSIYMKPPFNGQPVASVPEASSLLILSLGLISFAGMWSSREL